MSLTADLARAAGELAQGASGTSEAELAALVEALASARRLALYGCGREGLMMRALAMRLHHLGLQVQMVGDMACPPLGPGDLLLVSSGPGRLSTVAALMGQARASGARIACVTAEPGAPDPQGADLVLTIPAQTMARDQTSLSLLPMGSIFEGAMFLVFELLVLRLRDRLGETPLSMRARHTNLE